MHRVKTADFIQSSVAAAHARMHVEQAEELCKTLKLLDAHVSLLPLQLLTLHGCVLMAVVAVMVLPGYKHAEFPV